MWEGSNGLRRIKRRFQQRGSNHHGAPPEPAACVLPGGAAVLETPLSSSSSSSGGGGPFQADLSGQALTNLYNLRVMTAERMKRPLEPLNVELGPISHTGVRVTLEDGSKWLVHKGNGFGRSSQTVVTNARHMSNKWRVIQTKDLGGSKRVSDFVRAGGIDYNLLLDNCHFGSRRMMNLGD
ncbi:hypothetical protein OJAV_G00164390 [Oryzias javanicus]|uniref:Uncharacterized protein n=1 Tax=Oryzias javanicus TaxID=123683 RepID=A0A3S2MNE3_ORYJA|nr:hypothetical protein OJAV_G00164390 [Oryzias javanicus]